MTNENSELNEHFKADLAVAVKGLTAGGKFDASLAGSKHYALFEENYGKGVSCIGGDAILCNQIALNPTQDGVYNMYVEWTNSTASIPGITTWTTESIWSLMEFSHSAALRARKEDLSQAFTFLAKHPNVHRTLFRMQIISDWGRFELLVPSAIIRKPQTGELPKDAIWTNSSVSWKSPDGKYRDILIESVQSLPLFLQRPFQALGDSDTLDPFPKQLYRRKSRRTHQCRDTTRDGWDNPRERLRRSDLG